jgi:hypothetical protein
MTGPLDPPVATPNLPETIELKINPPTVALQLAPPTVSGQIAAASVGVTIGGQQAAVGAAQQALTVTAAPLRVVFAATPGAVGPPGPGGSGAVIIGAALTPTPDGATTLFTLPDTYIANSTGVFLNGIRERRGVHYTEHPPTQVQFSEAPLSTDTLSADYTVT